MSKTKNVCEAGDDVGADNDFGSAPGTKAKHSHGGCGARQPVYRMDALKIMKTFKSAKDEVNFLFCFEVLD